VPEFIEILRKFSTNQNFWGWACIPCTTAPTPLLTECDQETVVGIRTTFFVPFTWFQDVEIDVVVTSSSTGL